MRRSRMMSQGRTAAFPGHLPSEAVASPPSSLRSSESEWQARQPADTIPHIVWTAGPDGTVDYFNGRWYEYTGMTPEASLAQFGWRSAVHPADLERFFQVRDPAVGEGQFFQADIRLRDREGT